jgi:hypothetical protein
MRVGFGQAGGGAGNAAVYPARSTTEIRSSELTVAGKLTEAFSVAKLTVAVTPSSLFSFFSIRAAHDAQVIPPIDSSTERLSSLMAVIRACSLLVPRSHHGPVRDNQDDSERPAATP